VVRIGVDDTPQLPVQPAKTYPGPGEAVSSATDASPVDPIRVIVLEVALQAVGVHGNGERVVVARTDPCPLMVTSTSSAHAPDDHTAAPVHKAAEIAKAADKLEQATGSSDFLIASDKGVEIW
jgi:hypothetical protein